MTHMTYNSDTPAHKNSTKTAVIIGGGPAGLTAARELALSGTGITPIVIEAEDCIGGLCRTIIHNGLRIDIGGHRFFSKSDIVNDRWKSILDYDGKPETQDNVMMLRPRVSHIYFNRRFIDYPVTASWRTLRDIGLCNALRSACGYTRARICPRHPEKSLEDFYINRFGRTLYRMFFEDYTTKVWGIHPSEMNADWGSQRVKGLSISAVIRNMISRRIGDGTHVETSLIDHFRYPKYGPGQLWDAVAQQVLRHGGTILTSHRVTAVNIDDSRHVRSVSAIDRDGNRQDIPCDYVLSSMPLCNLVPNLRDIDIPEEILKAATDLPYRDFITVGLLVNSLAIRAHGGKAIPDTWIYIQDKGVYLGRLQIFNNWSQYLAPTHGVWLGLEYFCNQGDKLWNMTDEDFVRMAVSELCRIGIIHTHTDIRDSIRIRVPKAYPAYHGTYAAMPRIRAFLDSIQGLYCIGRNGQHRYNNMDHSMLTAIAAVNAIQGLDSKKDVWDVNTDDTYHEQR